MRMLRMTLPSFALMALASCASMTPPALTLPETWRSTALVSEQTPVEELTSQWWERFNSPELNRLITQAFDRNHDLKGALARVLQTEANARSTSAGFFPSISAGVSGSRTERQQPNGPDVASRGYQGTLQAAYQVDLFGQIRNAAASANRRLESSLYDRETVAITLVSSVITSYLQVLSARERLQLTTERLKNAEEILRLLETQRRVGVLSDLELAQQRSALASQRAALPGLRLAERQSLNGLAVLLGQNPEGFDIQGRALTELSLPVIASGIPSTLLMRRPDLRSAESGLRAANFDVAGARAARFPSIQLTASGGSSSGALADLFATGTFFYTLGASASETIFAGGRLLAQEQGARARYLELSEDYQQSVIAAFRDVENALEAVSQNGQQYDLAREASTQADLAYRLAQLRYRTGSADFQTVLNAQNSAFSAQESVVQGELSRFSAVVSLTLALGGGWDGATPDKPSMDAVYQPL